MSLLYILEGVIYFSYFLTNNWLYFNFSTQCEYFCHFCQGVTYPTFRSPPPLSLSASYSAATAPPAAPPDECAPAGRPRGLAATAAQPGPLGGPSLPLPPHFPRVREGVAHQDLAPPPDSGR